MIRKQTIFILLLFLCSFARAQAPDFVPYGEPEPLELTPFNIILYIVVPVLLFVALFFYRRHLKNKRKKPDK